MLHTTAFGGKNTAEMFSSKLRASLKYSELLNNISSLVDAMQSREYNE